MTLEQEFCSHYFPPVFSTRAPDGSCILTNSADNVLRLYNLPPQIYSYNWDSLPEMVDAHHCRAGDKNIKLAHANANTSIQKNGSQSLVLTC